MPVFISDTPGDSSLTATECPRSIYSTGPGQTPIFDCECPEWQQSECSKPTIVVIPYWSANDLDDYADDTDPNVAQVLANRTSGERMSDVDSLVIMAGSTWHRPPVFEKLGLDDSVSIDPLGTEQEYVFQLKRDLTEGEGGEGGLEYLGKEYARMLKDKLQKSSREDNHQDWRFKVLVPTGPESLLKMEADFTSAIAQCQTRTSTFSNRRSRIIIGGFSSQAAITTE